MKKKLLLSSAAIVFTILLSLFGYILILYAGDYVIDEKKLVMNSATRLVDEKGQLISKLYLENREIVSIDDVPEHVQNAFVAVEDTRFYQHHGIDVRAVFRALYKDIIAGSKVEGGSTITQQLAKNVFLTNDKTWLRKTKEVIIAINLEKKYSKSKLLEMYLNQIYFGHGAYGIQSASKLYFNKDVNQLTVDEGALLAGIPKAPSTYSPIANMTKAKERRDLILNLMQTRGYVTPEETVRYQGKTVQLDVHQQSADPALLTYTDMVFDEAKSVYGLSNEELLRGGYTITVPLNREVQDIAYQLFQDSSYFPGTDEHAEGAFVLLDNKTGGVLAAIGGRNYVQKGLNRVLVNRQPGSTLKPLAVYGPALEEDKFEPYSMLVDQKLSYGEYEPKNYNNIYKEKISMYDALLESSNAPAVWMLDQLGIDTGKKYLSKSGITIPDNGLSIALGGLEEGISPLDMAKAYRAFAANGQIVQPHVISKIVDRNQKLIGKPSLEEKDVFSKQTAWYMTRMLEGVVSEGTAKSGQYSGTLAGKTGTTNFPGKEGTIKDAWFVGFTPSVVGAVWMGYDRSDLEHHLEQGSSFPTRLMKDILEKSSLPKEVAFTMPSDVTELERPIRLADVNDLAANISFRPLGLFTVSLQWTPADDERVEYRIYKKTESDDELIASVEGEGAYELENVNIFSLPSYYVVPYNTQTDEVGKPSNMVRPEFFSRN
ncbi:transglycosylase domain-containing protein [Bacillus sp. PS06]|uniref:transglycosylase domain-containing protein n=1 Tax=Bacillus sp. PS06 TaxID=2764176 RepID=UPI00177E3B9D|nr:PBP1A family penicillin-binding protein [Bacillus sp. PS06]MBD8067627.1 PBP1A family penicillin-binding protein [Bacillus sp. PS06]